MNRDCGNGELVPIKWSVVQSHPQSDDETEYIVDTLQDALALFEKLSINLQPCSSVRVYAKDKQGYANCVIRKTITANGQVLEIDRRKELV